MFNIDTSRIVTEGLPEGDEDPEETCFLDSASERKWIEEKLAHLFDKKIISNDQIAIISFHHFSKDIFSTNCQVGRFEIVDERVKPCINHNQIPLIRAQRVKGLEYDYVIVIGFHEPDKAGNAPLLLYLSASRAKKGLYIAYRSKKNYKFIS